MPEAIRSLIIESDPETARVIDLLGRRSGSLDVRWTAGSVEEGADIVRKFRPDMAIVEVNGNPASAVGPLAKEFPNLYILALSASREAEYALETMRAGAHDLLCKPLREVDLSIAIEKARKARVRKDPAERRGKIVTVFSNKGGNGTTTIAANLSEALVTDHGKRVVVVDLVMGQGDVTMFFNVTPTYTVLDLARNSGKADPEYIDSLIVRHSSGVCILADPPRIEDAEQISADQVRDMLATLRSTFDVVVVDTPHQFDEKTLAALEMSDTILLVTLLNLPSLKNTQRSIELFARLGILDDRVQLVLSRYLPNDEISKGEHRRDPELPRLLRRPERLPDRPVLDQPRKAALRGRPGEGGRRRVPPNGGAAGRARGPAGRAEAQAWDSWRGSSAWRGAHRDDHAMAGEEGRGGERDRG